MKYLILSLGLLFSTSIFAQNVLNSNSPDELRKLREQKKDVKLKAKKQGDSIVYVVDTVSTKNEPLDYGFIEDKDLLWSKVTWEIIDLNEKANQIYYHSSDGLVSANQSLFEAITDGVRTGKIKEIYEDEFFKTKVTDVSGALGRLENTTIDEDGLLYLKEQKAAEKAAQPKKSVKKKKKKKNMTPDEIAEEEQAELDALTNTGDLTREDSLRFIDKQVIRNEKIRMFMIKGIWYIDKRLGEMRYRLLGISPLGPDAKTMNRKDIASGDELLPIFWIWYKDARNVLASYQVFNPDNNSSPITYDDMLNARRFSSVIYKSDSEFGNGDIKEYLPKDSKAQLEEHNRIKKSILEQENEMWNY